MAKVLEVQELEKVYPSENGQGRGLRGVSFSVNEGEGFTLLGPSGCGKTTTLRIIGGFEQADRGRVLFRDRDISQEPPQKRDIRTVFQSYALFPHLSVFDNIAFGPRMSRMPEAEVQKKLKEVLDLVEISHLANRRIAQLSGGEQQRVAVARAVVTEPSVLLLDEPLSALDFKLREKMQMELLQLRKKLGISFVFITHDQGEAMVLSDRIGVMKDGKLLQVASPEEIYQKPKTHFVARFIGQANFWARAEAAKMIGAVSSLPALNADDERWMLRPESMRLCDSELLSDEVGLKVRIVENVFMGEKRLLKLCDLNEEKPYLLSLDATQVSDLWRPGQEVLLSWKVGKTWVVSDASS